MVYRHINFTSDVCSLSQTENYLRLSPRYIKLSGQDWQRYKNLARNVEASRVLPLFKYSHWIRMTLIFFCYLFTMLRVSGKLPPWKLPLWKLLPRKLPPMKIPSMNIPPMKAPPCENYPPEICPRENYPLWKSSPWENYPLWNPLPTYELYKWKKKKKKIVKLFALKKAVQHNILNKITKAVFDRQMISQKILGLDTFFTEWKQSKNRTKAKIAKWHLLASRASQGELKLGSQTIKFGKYVKLLNSQLSLHITLWI